VDIDGFDVGLCRGQIVELRKYTKSMSVLLAEDYPALQKSLESIFSQLFKEVKVASDGLEALEIYKERKDLGLDFDILFSDIEMPNLNGVELTKQIKNIDPKQIIIIFSAHQDSNYLLELINLDVRRFILKPISLKNLLDELLLTCKSIYEKQDLSNVVLLSKDIIFCKKERDLYMEDKPVKLSNHEQLILELLVSKINQTVCMNEIVNYLYNHGIEIEFDNIRKMVYKLRKKFSNDLIQNIHSVGYRLRTSE